MFQYKNDMNKGFKTIPNYPNYIINKEGTIKNIKLGTTMRPSYVNNKPKLYPIVHLNNPTKTKCRVHRLVAQTFIPNPNNKPQADHIDRDIKNFNADNLRWATSKENRKNQKTPEKNDGNAISIIVTFEDGTEKEYRCAADACKEHGFLQGKISACIRGKRKSHHDCKFRLKLQQDILENEIWTPILTTELKNKGWNVSNLGHVKDTCGRIKKGTITEYYRVNIGGKRYAVHRLVLESFKGKSSDPNKTQVNHINEIKLDNRLENLEWVTSSENTIHSLGKKFIKCKNNKIIKKFNTVSEAANDIDFTRKRTYLFKHLKKNNGEITLNGFIWKYST